MTFQVSITAINMIMNTNAAINVNNVIVDLIDY